MVRTSGPLQKMKKKQVGWSKLGVIYKYKHPSLLAIKCHIIPRPQRVGWSQRKGEEERERGERGRGNQGFALFPLSCREEPQGEPRVFFSFSR